MRILVASDVWKPTVNGLVTIMAEMSRRLRREGHEVYILHPGLFSRIHYPWYPDVSLALNLWHTGRYISAWKPNCIHVATEGPMGLAARNWAVSRGLPITTAVHTRMDIHINVNLGLPASWVNAYMRWFHSASSNVLVHTEYQRQKLAEEGYKNLNLWNQGIDLELFKPLPAGTQPDDYLVYVGRISAEKDIAQFLDTPTQLRKVVVGDGPLLPSLRQKYPEVEFTGMLRGSALAEAYAKARLLVMPSRSETLGIVILEAMAAGVPVAAYPVMGPLSVVENGVNGWLDEDLGVAIENALKVDRAACRQYVEGRDWNGTVRQFTAGLNSAPQIHWNGRGLQMRPSLQP